MAAGGRFRVADDVVPRAVRLPAIQSRSFSHGLIAWALVLTALLVLPRSASLATVSADALQRASAATADLMAQISSLTGSAPEIGRASCRERV